MLRKLASLALCLSVLACASVRAGTLDKVIELKNLVDQNEPKKKWEKIHWQKDMDSALAEAQKQNKPVLVFMLVNEMGKTDAEHC